MYIFPVFSMKSVFCFLVKLKNGQLMPGYMFISSNKLKNGGVFICALDKDGVLYFSHALTCSTVFWDFLSKNSIIKKKFP